MLKIYELNQSGYTFETTVSHGTWCSKNEYMLQKSYLRYINSCGAPQKHGCTIVHVDIFHNFHLYYLRDYTDGRYVWYQLLRSYSHVEDLDNGEEYSVLLQVFSILHWVVSSIILAKKQFSISNRFPSCVYFASRRSLLGECHCIFFTCHPLESRKCNTTAVALVSRLLWHTKDTQIPQKSRN